MLKYLSRPYTTGFFVFISFLRFSFSLTLTESCLQWKQRGLLTVSWNQWKKPTIVSPRRRRDHESQIIALDMGRIPSHEFVVDEDRCFGCGACVALCPVQVLTLTDRMIYVDEPNCTHCRLCIPSCPVFALDIQPNE